MRFSRHDAWTTNREYGSNFVPLIAAAIIGMTVYQNAKQSTRLLTAMTPHFNTDCPGLLDKPMVDSKNYDMALEESLGFFDNIPQDDWELMRNITLARVNNADKRNPLLSRGKAPEWYQKNWDPDFSCRHDTKVGVGDGAKVCIRLLVVLDHSTSRCAELMMCLRLYFSCSRAMV